MHLRTESCLTYLTLTSNIQVVPEVMHRADDYFYICFGFCSVMKRNQQCKS